MSDSPSNSRRTSTYPRKILFAIVAGVIVVVIAMTRPDWVQLRVQEIDIRTGRIRETRRVLGIQIHQEVRESAISMVLSSQQRSTTNPDWHAVNTFRGFSGISEHHAYHGAISTTHLFRDMLQIAKFTDDARRQMAADVLRLWAEDQSYFAADRYLMHICDLDAMTAVSGGVVSLETLPNWRSFTRPTTRPDWPR